MHASEKSSIPLELGIPFLLPADHSAHSIKEIVPKSHTGLNHFPPSTLQNFLLLLGKTTFLILTCQALSELGPATSFVLHFILTGSPCSRGTGHSYSCLRAFAPAILSFAFHCICSIGKFEGLGRLSERPSWTFLA
jgi:hypothetical protein